MLLVVLTLGACTSATPAGDSVGQPPDLSGADADGRSPDGETVAVGARERGPTGAAASATADAVRIEPDESWQEVVDLHPPGTTFVIGAGLHRGAQVRARDGDQFLGEAGAILNGSMVLEDFERDGDVWVHDGVDLPLELTGVLDEGFEREGLRQDLYRNGGFMRHAPSEEEVGVGSWFYDFDTDRIVLGEDPGGHLIELGDVYSAFHGVGTRDVVIADLEIVQYAPPAQFGAVNGVSSIDWTIERVLVRASHGAGIKVDGGMVVRDSIIVGNGQIGVTGATSTDSERPVELVNNEIRENGRLGFTWFWEKGGIKLVGTEGAVVRDNLVVGNLGPGIWFDVENEGAVILDNEVANNAIIGVFYELSGGALIEGNVITDNGWDAGPLLAAGISVSNAGRVTVRNNVLSGNVNEYVVVYTERENLGVAPTDMVIEGNDFTLDEGFVGVSILTDDTDLYDPEVMQFRDNDYQLLRCDPCFFWDERISVQQWRDLGLDADSRFVGADP